MARNDRKNCFKGCVECKARMFASETVCRECGAEQPGKPPIQHYPLAANGAVDLNKTVELWRKLKPILKEFGPDAVRTAAELYATCKV